MAKAKQKPREVPSLTLKTFIKSIPSPNCFWANFYIQTFLFILIYLHLVVFFIQFLCYFTSVRCLKVIFSPSITSSLAPSIISLTIWFLVIARWRDEILVGLKYFLYCTPHLQGYLSSLLYYVNKLSTSNSNASIYFSLALKIYALCRLRTNSGQSAYLKYFLWCWCRMEMTAMLESLFCWTQSWYITTDCHFYFIKN